MSIQLVRKLGVGTFLDWGEVKTRGTRAIKYGAKRFSRQCWGPTPFPIASRSARMISSGFLPELDDLRSLE